MELLEEFATKRETRRGKTHLAAPNWYLSRYKTGRAYPKDVFSSDAEYFANMAAAYHDKLKILYDNGLRNVQIDVPNIACTKPPYLPSIR